MLSQYLKKNKKLAYHYAWRPEDIVQAGKSFGTSKATFCMCSIAPQNVLQFTIGSDIIFNLARKRQDIYADMACIYDKKIIQLIQNSPAPSFYAQQPIRNFDIIGISVYYIGSYFNIAPFFGQIGIPPLSKDRKSLKPLIVAGGGCISSNPEPIADFFDICIIGDGETPMKLLFDFYCQNKHLAKQDFLMQVKEIHTSFYIPALKSDDTKVYFNIEQDISPSCLGAEDFVSKPRNKTIELIRGCYYKCDFCQLSFMRKKAISMPVESIQAAIQSYPEDTSVYPFAPDESSYRHYDDIYSVLGGRQLYRFNQRFNTYKFTNRHSLNDYRVSFGLDGISQRIRDLVNKKITLQNITDSLRHAFQNFSMIKINTIIAFPFEQAEDWDEFTGFIDEILHMRKEVAPGKCLSDEENKKIYEHYQQRAFGKTENEDFDIYHEFERQDKLLMISLNPTPFQAEPHTPMQRLGIGDIDFARQKMAMLQKSMLRRYGGIKIEGMNSRKNIEMIYILKRAGRELTKCFLDMDRLGIYNHSGLGSVAGHFFKILKRHNINPANYSKRIGQEEPLTWDFIITGMETVCREREEKYN